MRDDLVRLRISLLIPVSLFVVLFVFFVLLFLLLFVVLVVLLLVVLFVVLSLERTEKYKSQGGLPKIIHLSVFFCLGLRGNYREFFFLGFWRLLTKTKAFCREVCLKNECPRGGFDIPEGEGGRLNIAIFMQRVAYFVKSWVSDPGKTHQVTHPTQKLGE